MFDPKPLWNFDDPAASELVFANLASDSETTTADLFKTQQARAMGLQDRFDAALELLGEIRSANIEVQAWLAIEHGRVLRSANQEKAARPLFEEAIARAQDLGNEALLIDAIHMLALVSNPDEQATLTLQALELAEESADESARNWKASLLNNLGVSYAEQGRWVDALDAFEQALVERKRLNQTNAVFPARYMIGWALRNLGRKAEALAWMTALQQDLLEAGRSDEYVAAELELLA